MTGITPGGRSYDGPTIPALDPSESPSVLAGIGSDALWLGPAGSLGTDAVFLGIGYGGLGTDPGATWNVTTALGSIAVSDEDVHGNLVSTWLETTGAAAGEVLTLVDIGAGVLRPQWEAAGAGSYLPLAGGTMTGPILGDVGSVSAPGYSFDGDTNTGIYRPAADTIGLAVAGAEVARARAGGMSVNSTATTFGTVEAFRVGTPATIDNATGAIFTAPAATASAAHFQAAAAATESLATFRNSAGSRLVEVTAAGTIWNRSAAASTLVGANNGAGSAMRQVLLYDPSNEITTIASNGSNVAQFYQGAAIRSSNAGSAGLPAYAWASDGDTGFYNSAANTIGISAGGTLRASVSTTALVLADGINISVGAGTGTKIGLATSDKIGFLGATPSAQLPPSGASGYAAGSGTAVHDLDTFTGAVGTAAYTIGDLVTALKLFGFINTN